MKSIFFTALVATLILAATVQVQSEEKDWTLNLDTISVTPNEQSQLKPIRKADIVLHVLDNPIPKIDIAYYFNKLIAQHFVALKDEHLLENKPALDETSKRTTAISLAWSHYSDSVFDAYIPAETNHTFVTNAADSVNRMANYKIEIDANSWHSALQNGVAMNLSVN